MDRARAIFELAIGQPKLDMPEVLWKAYIDFEIEQEEYDRTRKLYQCLLQRTHHVKVRSLRTFGLAVVPYRLVGELRYLVKSGNIIIKAFLVSFCTERYQQ